MPHCVKPTPPGPTGTTEEWADYWIALAEYYECLLGESSTTPIGDYAATFAEFKTNAEVFRDSLP